MDHMFNTLTKMEAGCRKFIISNIIILMKAGNYQLSCKCHTWGTVGQKVVYRFSRVGDMDTILYQRASSWLGWIGAIYWDHDMISDLYYTLFPSSIPSPRYCPPLNQGKNTPKTFFCILYLCMCRIAHKN